MADRRSPLRCYCACHRGSLCWFPPDVRDPVEAVTACTKCLNDHTPALECKAWPIVPPANPILLPPWNDEDATGSDGKGTE
jgi:hypothetical protein